MDTLFDKDFYPTPREVIEQMLINVEVAGKTVLEPSAGSGSIVDVLRDYGASHVVACETNSDLRRLLSTKCEVIADDFLSLAKDDVSAVQLIVANVPFSDQVRHISHMFDIAPEGCEIVTLCNGSIFDRWSKTEKELAILETVEAWGWHENLGRVFSESDRPTDVNVGLIHVFKPRTGDNIFDDFFVDELDEPQNQAAGIVPYNEIRDYVNRYVDALRRFDDTMKANTAINGLISVFGDSGITFGAFGTTERYGERHLIDRNQFRIRLQKQAWRHVFSKFDMGRYLTSSTMRDLDAAIAHQSNFPFTMRNIYRMIDLLMRTHQDRMKRCITEAFDRICSFSAENSTAGEKWKTNSDYMVNRKFIVPYICSHDPRFDYCNTKVKVNFESSVLMDDIVKALCTVTGRRYEDLADDSLYNVAGSHAWGVKFRWTFFTCKGFKKGTMHFEFIDENTWAIFNRTVAEIRGWKLPSNTKKTRGNCF